MSKTTLTFIADTHYYSKSLGTEGEAYLLRSESDQKCLAETSEIIDSAFSKLAESDCDAVLIAGDLTNDGERVCHEEFREKLYRLREKKKVYVVTATHDWCCDRNPRRFEGDKVYNDVPTLNHNELYGFYRDFGTGDAVSEYRTTLGPASYAVDIGDNVTLLALIDDKNGRNHAGFKKAHLEWILEQIRSAVARGRVPVAMEHHLLYPHISKLVTNGSRCDDCEDILTQMADAGLQFVFVGHSHIQRIDEFTTPAGNKIYEINVGSLVGYPAPMVTLTVEDGGADINTEFLSEFTLNGEKRDLTDYLKNHATRLISVIFEAAVDRDREMLKKRFEALGVKAEPIMKYYFLIGPVLRKIAGATVGGTGRALNALTLSRAVDKNAVNALGDMPLLDAVNQVFLNLIDGGITKYSPEDSFYRVVKGALSTPLRISRSLHLDGKMSRLFAELDSIAEEALTGGRLDNHKLKLHFSK